MKKKVIKQPDFKLAKSQTTAIQNNKYRLEAFDTLPLEDEGGINSFQIYDSLSKQIVHEGKQLMPNNTSSHRDDIVAALASDLNQQLSGEGQNERRESTTGNNDDDVDEFDDPNFFEKRTGKKRSLTDEYHKFNVKKQDLLQQNHQSYQSQERVSRGQTTNDTNSQRILRISHPMAQHHPHEAGSIENPGSISDKLSNVDDYIEKKERAYTINKVPYNQEENKSTQLGFFVMPDFWENQFSQTPITSGRKNIEFQRNIFPPETTEEDEDESEEIQQRTLDQQRKKYQSKQNQSYYQLLINKSINFKYKMPESKHFSTLAKLFTDFQKVTFDQKDFPIFLLDQIYTIPREEDLPRQSDRRKIIQSEIQKIQTEFKNRFYSIINVTYRKGFKPLLTEDIKLIMLVNHQLKSPEKTRAVHTTTDSSWGCTIRVGQMMLCQSIMRHLIGYDQNLWRIIEDPQLQKHYKQVLKLIMDNDDSHVGAFSIQNVAKMGLCHKKYPGEWYGPHAITDLNKLYQPIKNFQICIFHDGNIHYDKIRRLATQDQKLSQLQKQYQENPDKRDVHSSMEFIFQKYFNQIGYFKTNLPMSRKPSNIEDPFVNERALQERDYQDENNSEKEQSPQQDNPQWKNGVLVIIPTRLGLNKVNKEYFQPILSVFQCQLNVGIIGGRPSQALYFVGAQNKDLILLDPHYVQDSILNDEDLSIRFPTYHTNLMKKINISKIDTTLAFGFYLKDEVDFEMFKGFLEQGKHFYKENWLFSHFDVKPKGYVSQQLEQTFSVPSTIESHNYLPKTAQVSQKNSRFDARAPEYDSPALRPSLALQKAKSQGIASTMTNNQSQNQTQTSLKKKLSKSQIEANEEEDDFELI